MKQTDYTNAVQYLDTATLIGIMKRVKHNIELDKNAKDEWTRKVLVRRERAYLKQIESELLERWAR